MAGRKPKPTNLKVINGNPGKRPLPKNEPIPEEGAVPMPRGMDPIAQRVWKQHAPELIRLKLLKPLYADMFKAYCEAMAEYEKAMKFVKEKGAEYPVFYTDPKTGKFILDNKKKVLKDMKPFPQKVSAQQWLKIAKGLASEFGLTPSAISTIDVTKEDEREDDKFLFGL